MNKPTDFHSGYLPGRDFKIWYWCICTQRLCSGCDPGPKAGNDFREELLKEVLEGVDHQRIALMSETAFPELDMNGFLLPNYCFLGPELWEQDTSDESLRSLFSHWQ